jgi:single-stranded DNA-binding protein
MIRAAVNGRIGGDPQERESAKGTPMATASAAVNVARDGAEVVTEWINLVGFGPAADALLRCKKGDVNTAIGQLTKSTFTTRDGKERSNWSLRIDQIVSARDPSPPLRQTPSNNRPGPSPYSRRALPADRVDNLWPEAPQNG